MKTFRNPALSDARLAADFISLSKQGRFIKNLEFVADWRYAAPAKPYQLKLVHDPKYVEGVLYEGALTGFHRPGNAALLAHILASVGCEVAATEWVMEHGGVACAPVSGFHHAHWNGGAGYCTFNGLLVAVACAAPNKHVLIVDGDGHHGDGTDEILSHDFPFLKNVKNLTHYSPDPEWRVTEEGWHGQIERALNYRQWDLVLYQAGADAHKDDPYKAGYLSHDEWFSRDALVFKHCQKKSIPCVFNFAGGYSEGLTVELHQNTWDTAHRVYRELQPHA